jgi:HlyD family secretion protein
MRFFRWLNRNKWWLLAAIILFGGLYFGIKANFGKKKGPTMQEYTVEKRDIKREETVNGTLESKTQIDVKSKVGGILKEILVKEGDAITAGQVLARIDEIDLRKDLRTAQARFDLAQAQYEKAKKGGTREQVSSLQANLKDNQVELDLARENLKRIQSLFDKGYSSDQELEDAKGRFERAKAAFDDTNQRLKFVQTGASVEDKAIAEATLKQARIGLDLANEDLTNATIHSEVTGKVLSVELDPGDTVVPSVQGQTGNVIMIVGDTTSILVKCDIGEDLIGVLKEGMPVDFELSFIKGRTVPGKITRISHFGKPNDNGVVMFPMEMELTGNIGEPRLGSTAKGTIKVAEVKGALALPVVAVTSSEGEKIVKKSLGGGRTEDVEVTTGISDGQFVEILSGLKEGDKVMAEFGADQPGPGQGGAAGGRRRSVTVIAR